jgi:hypothetical protein
MFVLFDLTRSIVLNDRKMHATDVGHAFDFAVPLAGPKRGCHGASILARAGHPGLERY